MGVVTQHFKHATLGHIHVLVKPTAKSIKAWWKGQVLQVTCPSISGAELSKALEKMAPNILAGRPQALYHIGQKLEFDLFSITLKQQTFKPLHAITNHVDDHEFVVGIGTSIDVSSESGENLIDKVICSIAKKVCLFDVLFEAEQLSGKLGVFPPDGYEVGHGRKRLGCCKNARSISLSFMLAFLPEHLRKYVICHELAHLTHMDHSAEFHALVNQYTDGNEARLEAELRNFAFPVKR